MNYPPLTPADMDRLHDLATTATWLANEALIAREAFATAMASHGEMGDPFKESARPCDKGILTSFVNRIERLEACLLAASVLTLEQCKLMGLDWVDRVESKPETDADLRAFLDAGMTGDDA